MDMNEIKYKKKSESAYYKRRCANMIKTIMEDYPEVEIHIKRNDCDTKEELLSIGEYMNMDLQNDRRNNLKLSVEPAEAYNLLLKICVALNCLKD